LEVVVKPMIHSDGDDKFEKDEENEEEEQEKSKIKRNWEKSLDLIRFTQF
jgi:hypothetical protein